MLNKKPNYGKKSHALSNIFSAHESYFGGKFDDSNELEEYRQHIFYVLAKSPLVFVKFNQMPSNGLTQRPFVNLDIDLGELED
ncbi:MAG: hypothetical protein FWC80_01375 [Firmicutes bacterium]|nr:hypothetical protein [Bacillota bacterium]